MAFKKKNYSFIPFNPSNVTKGVPTRQITNPAPVINNSITNISNTISTTTSSHSDTIKVITGSSNVSYTVPDGIKNIFLTIEKNDPSEVSINSYLLNFSIANLKQDLEGLVVTLMNLTGTGVELQHPNLIMKYDNCILLNTGSISFQLVSKNSNWFLVETSRNSHALIDSDLLAAGNLLEFKNLIVRQSGKMFISLDTPFNNGDYFNFIVADSISWYGDPSVNLQITPVNENALELGSSRIIPGGTYTGSKIYLTRFTGLDSITTYFKRYNTLSPTLPVEISTITLNKILVGSTDKGGLV
jgi:hypothetical protein